jgi:asparagine synthase (glutamine-hydrolysing)
MNSIFGRINSAGNPINEFLFKSSIEALSVFSDTKKEISIESNYGFGQILFPPFLNSNIQNSTKKIVSDSKLYNITELAQKLNIKEKEPDDSFVILKAFEKWGKDCVRYFIGDFAFAIWDSENQELFCARDHFGIKPFNYYFNDGIFIFSSDVSGILAQTDLRFNIDEQYIADTISIVKSEHFRTNYREIKKLHPSHYLQIKKKKIEIKQYWNLEQKEKIQKEESEIIDNFKNLLIESVKCRLRDNSTGTELSGGLDSSGITGIASQFSQIKTFSHILPDDLLGKVHPFKDEREFINILADHCKIKNRNFITSENISFLSAISENISSFKGITQQNFGVFSDHLYQHAMKEKVSVLLSGFGGDEVVTSKSLKYLSDLAKNNQWKELKRDLKTQKPNKFRIYKSLLKYYLKFKTPLIYKLISFEKDENPWWFGKYENLAINSKFAKKLNIKDRYFSYYKKLKTNSLQEINIERITHPHVSQRIEYCSLIARKYGIEYRYPLLDKRLIEFYLSIPIRLKARNGIGRYAIRKAIEGIVPEKIQWRNDKSGATISTVYMRFIKNKDQISEIISKAKSNKAICSYIDVEKFEIWFQKYCQRSETGEKDLNPAAFYNYLKLIIFIEQNPTLF